MKSFWDDWWIGALSFALSLLVLLVLSYALPAHEAMSGWQYPYECCSNKDCHEYPGENVTVEGDGFRLKEGEYIPRSKARISPDGHYHICRYEGEGGGALISSYDAKTEGSLPCFWYPPQGF